MRTFSNRCDTDTIPIFGYGGLQLHPDDIRLNPTLPENVTALNVRELHYRGNVIDLTIGSLESKISVRSADIEVTLLVLQVVANLPEWRCFHKRTRTKHCTRINCTGQFL